MSLGELTAASNDHRERIVALEERSEHTVDATKSLVRKIDKLQHWMLGLLGTAVIHLILFALTRK